MKHRCSSGAGESHHQYADTAEGLPRRFRVAIREIEDRSYSTPGGHRPHRGGFGDPARSAVPRRNTWSQATIAAHSQRPEGRLERRHAEARHIDNRRDAPGTVMTMHVAMGAG